jgi:hypothetical protein
MITVSAGARPPRFELLVVGQDIESTRDWWWLTRQLHRMLCDELPDWAHPTTYADLQFRDLGLVASPPGMQADGAKVKSYLLGIELPAGGEKAPLERWSMNGRTPSGGLLVLLLGGVPNATMPTADGFRAGGADDLPPMVLVQLGAEAPGGLLWTNAVRRAAAQMRFGLFDEHEYPGPEYTRPSAEMTGEFNNVLFLTETQRTRLQSAPPPTWGELVGATVRNWPLSKGQTLTFTPHAGPDTDLSTAGALATPLILTPFEVIALHEGAAGFRTYAVRGAADCLMRRMPGSSALPVQAPVGFCPVCRHLMDYALDEGEERALLRPVLFAAQRTQFDKLNWPAAPTRLTGAAARGFGFSEAPATGATPRWSAEVKVNAATAGDEPAGLVFNTVNLTHRDDDPFVNSPRVFARLAFENLAYRIEGDANPTPLDVGAALNATGELEPELLIQRDAGDFVAQLGYRLTLRWELPSGWRIEATQSCVLMRRNNNIDPGQAVFGCKVYPQVALRAVRRPDYTGELPKIASLDATVLWRMNNVVSVADEQAMMDAGMQGTGMTDAVDASLFTDGNDVHGGADYELEVDLVPLVLPLIARRLPSTTTLRYKSLRRIAGVQKFGSTPMAAFASLVWWQHKGDAEHFGRLPILPFWSWLFDYTQPRCTPKAGDNLDFTGVYAIDESTPGGRSARDRADVAIAWPPRNAFADLNAQPQLPQPVLHHRRFARQGVWDNVHVTAPMGIDERGREIVSAPVCADKCFHLHWRWGVDGVRIVPMFVKAPERHYGWSIRGPIRSNAEIGLPLIPPNQHLEVTLARRSPGELDIRYAVSARAPQERHWQVLCEQGGGFAYSYQGLDNGAFLMLCNTVREGLHGGVSPAARRAAFPKIYARLRWFDPYLDGAVDPTTQQIPTLSELPPAKRDELERT